MPLTIHIPERKDFWNPIINKFEPDAPEETLVLEHSLISVSKWEAKWKVSWFKGMDNKTSDQLYSYIQCMVVKGNSDMSVIKRITKDIYNQIMDYVEDSMTATVVQNEKKPGGNDQFITSELIYAWMVEYRIPPQYEKWHLARLITLINVLNERQKKPKKLTRQEQVAKQRSINERNKARFKKGK